MTKTADRMLRLMDRCMEASIFRGEPK